MSKTLILVGGHPGAGKTYVVNLIMNMAPELVSINQDAIEEDLYDTIGFNNQNEKTALVERSRNIYYAEIKEAMSKGLQIITDYPFSYKQKPYFEEYANKYGYEIITIRLVGDLVTLYERRIKRDLNPNRHLAHMVTKYHKGDVLEDRRQADALLTYEQFVQKVTESGYADFQMGHLINVDVTDFNKVDYAGIVRETRAYMKLNSFIDHTNLKQDATKADIKKLCEEAIEHKFATVAINSCWTKYAAGLLDGSGVGITTCVGFPLGQMASKAKAAEAFIAVEDGTTEIDMVMNVGALKDGDDEYVIDDVSGVVQAASGVPVKVILECCLLTDEEIVRACKDCVEAGASFVKTSTGFSTSGATIHDVSLMSEAVGTKCKVKAAGGIHNKADALNMIDAGADRIGASAGILIVTEK